MKSLSKLHAEAIAQAKTVNDQNKAAAMAMIETPIEMIKSIMLKHELAVIEVMRELHEAKEAAVRVEREACYTIAKFNQANNLEHLTAEQIKARG
jgi:hypothetical protein